MHFHFRSQRPHVSRPRSPIPLPGCGVVLRGFSKLRHRCPFPLSRPPNPEFLLIARRNADSFSSLVQPAPFWKSNPTHEKTRLVQLLGPELRGKGAESSVPLVVFSTFRPLLRLWRTLWSGVGWESGSPGNKGPDERKREERLWETLALWDSGWAHGRQAISSAASPHPAALWAVKTAARQFPNSSPRFEMVLFPAPSILPLYGLSSEKAQGMESLPVTIYGALRWSHSNNSRRTALGRLITSFSLFQSAVCVRSFLCAFVKLQ